MINPEKLSAYKFKYGLNNFRVDAKEIVNNKDKIIGYTTYKTFDTIPIQLLNRFPFPECNSDKIIFETYFIELIKLENQEISNFNTNSGGALKLHGNRHTISVRKYHCFEDTPEFEWNEDKIKIKFTDNEKQYYTEVYDIQGSKVKLNYHKPRGERNKILDCFLLTTAIVKYLHDSMVNTQFEPTCISVAKMYEPDGKTQMSKRHDIILAIVAGVREVYILCKNTSGFAGYE